MKDKILIGTVLLFFLALFIGMAYLLKIKSENALVKMPRLAVSKVFNLGPNFNRFETDKEYIIRGYMPNLEKGKINVTIDGDSFIISSESKITNEDSKGGFYKSATSFSSFTQTIPVPENSDPSRAKTEYKDGYLVITIPKNKKDHFNL